MSVSANLANSEVLAPSISANATPILHLANNFTAAISNTSNSLGVLDFETDSTSEHPLSNRLASADWNNVWESAIALSLSAEWRKRFRDVQLEFRRGQTGSDLTNSTAFAKLNNMLEGHCPELSIRERAAERFGLHLKGNWLDLSESVVNKSVQGSVGYVLAEVVLPSAGWFGALGVGAGIVIGETAKKIIPQLKGLGMNPLSKEGLWSTRSTLFDVVRRKN